MKQNIHTLLCPAAAYYELEHHNKEIGGASSLLRFNQITKVPTDWQAQPTVASN